MSARVLLNLLNEIKCEVCRTFYLFFATSFSDSFTILGLWVLGLSVSHINESNCKLMSPEHYFTGLPRSRKKFWKIKIFQVREKSGNYIFSQGNLKKMKKVVEKSENFKILLKRC